MQIRAGESRDGASGLPSSPWTRASSVRGASSLIWALFARGDALFQTNRPTFDVNLGPSVNLGYSNAPSVVVQPGIVTGRASLGLELRF